VIVLSTDTEVDQAYYRDLEPHLQHAVHLLFDKNRELTTLREGYFWRN
jgi:DNA sulfur modification protein DndD